MTVKMILALAFMAVIDLATSIVATIGIYNMPIMTGVSTSDSNAKSRTVNDLEIPRIDIQFFW